MIGNLKDRRDKFTFLLLVISRTMNCYVDDTQKANGLWLIQVSLCLVQALESYAAFAIISVATSPTIIPGILRTPLPSLCLPSTYCVAHQILEASHCESCIWYLLLIFLFHSVREHLILVSCRSNTTGRLVGKPECHLRLRGYFTLRLSLGSMYCASVGRT